jgi:hypothetical protein
MTAAPVVPTLQDPTTGNRPPGGLFDASCERRADAAGNHGHGLGRGRLALGATAVRLGDRNASALTQTEGAGKLSSLARIAAAEAFHTNGFGLALCSARYRLMAACRSTTE